MEWTKEDKKRLLEFRKNLDSDDIRLKQEIKDRLLANRNILHVLNNDNLSTVDATPNDYYGVNILPYFIIPDTQTEIQNFICYETAWNQIPRNDVNKLQNIVFYILCERRGGIDKETALPRHDLLAALIEKEFNWEILSCGRIAQVSSKSSVTDNNYITRTLTFECATDRNIVKTMGGKPSIINHGGF